ncbi:TadE/TadG family type IV pilus assembly protein [Streptomyces sp. ISID311]|uniref:TadE/TadG family type IV pilus assembly protein n=1 Tax=Streptomyces sp. ISID311 TaxID=2601673 RepID=UPI0011BD3CE8|nr:TadE/TadG family type IV pilus assembly protein [Streptomyces sp. ISID311]TXC95284.1 pilus assembly protein TadE [Streptomyces sp. ISID311]
MEMVLVTPLLMVVLLVVVALGRLADARLVVDDAAHQAARAVSLARNERAARIQAGRTAATALKEAGATCRGPSVTVTTGGLTPGANVSARVSCAADLGDLTHTGMPGRVRLVGTAVSAVDSFRGTP